MSPMFVPGPVDVAPEVLAAQARPMLPHHSPEFEELFRRTAEKLQRLFFPQGRVFQCTASGSGMQEAAVRNFVRERVLCCTNGAYGERWYQVALANGKQAERLDIAWGDPLNPEKLVFSLQQVHYDAVTLVHNETSTGVENPLPELCRAVHEASSDTLILVDAVSSLGGVKIEMEEWGIDFLFTSSQQCLALPPGLALASASDRAMRFAETVEPRGWYFDLLRMDYHRLRDSTPMTPVMPLLYALDVQLDRILGEGLEARCARHAAMARRIQAWGAEKGLSPMANEPWRSRTVSVLQNSLGWDIPALNKFLLQRGMRIAEGYGVWKGRSLCIATMGETSLADCENLIAALDEYLAQLP
jgi:aspartate aminotransferase-like enzyme